MEEIVKILKTGIEEKIIIEHLMSLQNEPTKIEKIEKIGDNLDIDCEFKNNLFDEVYIDEKGAIIDLRIKEQPPEEDEIENLAKYWEALYKKFNRPVQPCFIIYGEPSN